MLHVEGRTTKATALFDIEGEINQAMPMRKILLKENNF